MLGPEIVAREAIALFRIDGPIVDTSVSAGTAYIYFLKKDASNTLISTSPFPSFKKPTIRR